MQNNNWSVPRLYFDMDGNFLFLKEAEQNVMDQ